MSNFTDSAYELQSSVKCLQMEKSAVFTLFALLNFGMSCYTMTGCGDNVVQDSEDQTGVLRKLVL